jgi:hypothetical protein
MPAYKNNSTAIRFLLDGMKINPGQVVTNVNNFVTLPSGVSKVSELPVWNPVIVSSRHAGNASDSVIVILPTVINGENVNDYIINIFCSAGRVGVKFNTTSFSPEQLLDLNEGYEEKIRYRKITKVIINFKIDNSICKIDVQKV